MDAETEEGIGIVAAGLPAFGCVNKSPPADTKEKRNGWKNAHLVPMRRKWICLRLSY